MELLIVLFIVHWLFDYVFQTREIANSKWTDINKLFQHTVLYSLGPAFFTLGIVIFAGYHAKPGMITMFVFMNLVFHFLTDFFTSKATHMLWEQKKEHAFFVVLGLDQLLHITALLSTAQWYLGITIQ